MNKAVRTDSPFITDILDSLGRRSKALKHQNATPLIERFIDIREGATEERIEITFRMRGRQSLTLSVWEDRTLRVHACEAVWQAGWKFHRTCSGRFIGSDGGREIVRAIEVSLSAMFEMTNDSIAELDSIWEPLLAKGPQSV